MLISKRRLKSENHQETPAKQTNKPKSPASSVIARSEVVSFSQGQIFLATSCRTVVHSVLKNSNTELCRLLRKLRLAFQPTLLACHSVLNALSKYTVLTPRESKVFTFCLCCCCCCCCCCCGCCCCCCCKATRSCQAACIIDSNSSMNQLPFIV